MAVRRTLLLTKLPQTHNKGSYCLPDLAGYIRTFTFAAVVLNMLVCGCNRQAVSLSERITKYWEARVNGDVEATYALEAPDTISQPSYREKLLKSPVAFKTFTIKSIKENGDEAEVELEVGYLLPGLSRPASSTMVDKWVKVHGRWYHKLPAGDSGTT
jgi:hypothetical protein